MIMHLKLAYPLSDWFNKCKNSTFDQLAGSSHRVKLALIPLSDWFNKCKNSTFDQLTMGINKSVRYTLPIAFPGTLWMTTTLSLCLQLYYCNLK